jgi:hypothetical protein
MSISTFQIYEMHEKRRTIREYNIEMDLGASKSSGSTPGSCAPVMCSYHMTLLWTPGTYLGNLGKP